MAILFADNDIVLKLSAFGLMDEAAQIVGVPAQDVRILSSALPLFRKRRDRLSRQYTAVGVDRAIRFVEHATSITQDIHLDDQEAMSGVEGLDPGEVILFSAVRDVPEGCLFTGDKRSLMALAAAVQTRYVFDRLRGRVVCLEEIIRALLDRNAFGSIRASVVPAAGCDTAVRVIFGSGMDSTEANVRLAIDGYIADLEESVGYGWLKRL